jgi:pimeloyl-ACP methyl ester carboxylesterase
VNPKSRKPLPYTTSETMAQNVSMTTAGPARLFRNFLAAFALLFSVVSAENTFGAERPVKAIADHTIRVASAKGTGLLPAYISLDGRPVDLSRPQPVILHALVVFHGKARDADVYNHSGVEAIEDAGAAGNATLLVTPQFLGQVDIQAFHLGPGILRWAPEEWMGGANALNAPLSSFDAIDTILAMLADRKLFPNLQTVVLAGHSAGGQLVQRYAVAGRGGDALTRLGIRVRYVVANPSSYAYFNPERPVLNPVADFSFAVPSQTCSGEFNHWKYGLLDPPQYLASSDVAELERRYVARNVIYLLGTSDTDPHHPALDVSCPAELEGPYRLFRGKAYLRYLQLRHPELAEAQASQQVWLVPGVGHEGGLMFRSACGLAALFNSGQCATRVLDPKP